MNARKVRGFLLQQPRAAVIRLSTAEGVPQEIRPGGRSLAKVAETIEAVGPELVECLDKDGNLIRAMRPEPDMPARSEAAEIPEGLTADPNALMLTHFSNLIHRAYEHSTEIAFAKLVELVERIDARSDSIEQRLERTEARYRGVLEDQIQDAFARANEVAEQAGAEGSTKDEMIQAFLVNALQRPRPAAPNGHANEKGK